MSTHEHAWIPVEEGTANTAEWKWACGCGAETIETPPGRSPLPLPRQFQARPVLNSALPDARRAIRAELNRVLEIHFPK